MKRCTICVGICVLALPGCGSSAHAPTRAAREAAEMHELGLTLEKAKRLALETTGGRETVEMVPASRLKAQIRQYQTLQESLRRAYKKGEVVSPPDQYGHRR
jgi:TRAP-type C4-dicarboxylate transport system substrate-binding protein